MVEELDATATAFVRDHVNQFTVEIKNTTGAVKDAYMKVQEQVARPERVGIELPDNEIAAAEDAAGKSYPTFEQHLYADENGSYPINLNDWEAAVVSTELRRRSTIGWYRNPGRSTRSALRIAYQDEAEVWKSLQVDFVVISKRDDGSLAASIMDPHGDHLADAKFKLRALADYAEEFGDEFIRIESIAKVGGGLRALDLLDPQVREAVRAFEGGKVTPLYGSDVARDYV